MHSSVETRGSMGLKSMDGATELASEVGGDGEVEVDAELYKESGGFKPSGGGVSPRSSSTLQGGDDVPNLLVDYKESCAI